MNLIQIKGQIDNGNNLIFYNKDVYKYYDGLMNDYLCIYFNEPLPVKVRLIECINKVSNRKRPSLKRQTMEELKKILVKELHYEKLVIIFNHFERLTKRSVQIYQYLNSLKNIQFILTGKHNNVGAMKQISHDIQEDKRDVQTIDIQRSDLSENAVSNMSEAQQVVEEKMKQYLTPRIKELEEKFNITIPITSDFLQKIEQSVA